MRTTARTALAISLLAAPVTALALACGAQSSDATTISAPQDGGASATRDGASFPAPADAGAIGLASGVILVHAASFPAFRVCFQGTLSSPPLPTDELMPESNVVGVDVGSAVRVDSPKTTLGKAYLFTEESLRTLYPPGVETPSCSTLLGAPGTADLAVTLPPVEEDLSFGVHVLALTGCRAAAQDPTATTARCGPNWASATGNLELTHVELPPSVRPAGSPLPVQALELSAPLASRGRSIDLSFGVIDASTPAPVIANIPSAVPYPSMPARLDFDAEDAGTYASVGFFVSLGAKTDGGDAGPRELVVAQSLADVQRLSNPRILPQAWYGASSTYVIVVLGDADPRFVDGGPDPDPRRRPHLLAVPLQELEEPDAGP